RSCAWHGSVPGRGRPPAAAGEATIGPTELEDVAAAVPALAGDPARDPLELGRLLRDHPHREVAGPDRALRLASFRELVEQPDRMRRRQAHAQVVDDQQVVAGVTREQPDLAVLAVASERRLRLEQYRLGGREPEPSRIEQALLDQPPGDR